MLIVLSLIALNTSARIDDKCGAFYIKDSIMAAFPLIKNKDKWIWYKKKGQNMHGWQKQDFMKMENLGEMDLVSWRL